MSKQSTSSSGGIGFCGLLTVAFIVLKLTNYILVVGTFAAVDSGAYFLGCYRHCRRNFEVSQ